MDGGVAASVQWQRLSKSQVNHVGTDLYFIDGMKVSRLQLLQADLVLWTAGSQPSSKGSDFHETSEKKKSRLSLPFPLNGKVCLWTYAFTSPTQSYCKSALMELQCRSSRDHLCFHHTVGGSGDRCDAAGRVAHPCVCAGRCFRSGRATVQCAARHRAGMPRKRKNGQFPQHRLQWVTFAELMCRRPMRCRPPRRYAGRKQE